MMAEQISHYRIINQLGAGGMGEVYLAEDTQLGRKIALKLLPEKFTQDEDRVRRFEREARAASALNHPNIITIYEIGQVEATHYIATEFIDGQTLRQQIAGRKLTLNAALEVAIQVASALTAAHEAGITHRDVKPENIMVRRDGIVKVLDFGLAKLTERRATATDSDAPTKGKVETDPGTVMGTAQYMSPEQARGQEVDARSDIFSLGGVLYEMIAGRAPFEGPSANDVIAAILTKEPPPLSRFAPEVPTELQRIAAKALRKERDERYQGIKDLLVDLKSLKQDLELEAKLKGGADFEMRKAESVEPDAQSAIRDPQSAMVTRTTSSAEIFLSEIKRHKRGVVLALVIFIIAGAGAASWLSRWIGQRQPAAALKITRLTFTGKATEAAISPDGKYVAYVQAEGGEQSLWLSQVAVSSHNQIVPPAEVVYRSLTFSGAG
jgi:serine/threonine protein kinase